MEEESAYPAQKGPVNRGQHSAEECPFLAAVMWDRGVGVMQERAHDCQASDQYIDVMSITVGPTNPIRSVREAVQMLASSLGAKIEVITNGCIAAKHMSYYATGRLVL